MSAQRPEDGSEVWSDPDPLDPAWPAPSDVDPTWAAPAAPTTRSNPSPEPSPEAPTDAPPRRRRALLGLGIVGAVILAVALVAGFGGFTEREDLATRVAPGTTFTTGPYEMTFTSATVQRTKQLDDDMWEISVLGRGRTTGDESVTPSVGVGQSMFAALDDQGKLIRPESVRYGADRRISDGTNFTPGLPAIDFAVEFEIKPPYTPGSELVFAAWSQEFRDISLLGNQDPTWANGKQYWRYVLPMKRLADETS